MRRLKPNRIRLRRVLLTILSISLVWLILSAVFPFPEGTWNFLSIGTLGQGRQAVAQAASTNGMAYAEVNKSGCTVRNGNCQIRLDFFLEPADARYYDKYLYLVDTESAEYLAGYKGEVDKDGNPVDPEDYQHWLDSLPHEWVNTPFHSHFIYLPPDFTNDDIKAAIDIHLGNFYKAFQDGWDAVQGGMRHGWDVATRIRPTDYSKSDTPQQYDSRVTACQDAIDDLMAFSYKPDGEIQGETFPSTDIDIGVEAIDRGAEWTIGATSYVRTIVNQDNPANDTGVLDYVEVYTNSWLDGICWIGTFEHEGSNVLTVHDSEGIGVLTGYTKNTNSGIDIDVNSGEYIGVSSKSPSNYCRVETDSTGGSGNWYLGTECIDPEDSDTFSNFSGYQTSLYGTGETEAAEPSIANTPDSNAFGILEIGSQATTGFEYFTITNNGTVAVDVTIQGGNMTGGDDDVWTLSDTATPDENVYGLRASTDAETLYENYDSSRDNDSLVGGAAWSAQAFTPASSHTITSVQLKMWRSGSPGTLTIAIRNTSAGLPTGSDLCSGTTNGNTLPTSFGSSEWREIVFDDNVLLSASTQYAIILSAPSAPVNNYACWNTDTTSPTYAGGTRCYSENSGSSWTSSSTIDLMFKEYGGDFDVIIKQTPTYNTLVSNLTAEDTQDWGLLLYMPTSLSGYDMGQMTGTITLVASEAS